jgi:hypothetical protein
MIYLSISNPVAGAASRHGKVPKVMSQIGKNIVPGPETRLERLELLELYFLAITFCTECQS